MNVKNIAIVTGGSSNLGAAISKRLASSNFIVYSTFSSSKPDRNSKEIRWLMIDITKENSVREVVNQVYSKENRIDLLINCAGISMSGKLEDSTLKDFEKVLDVNTKGTYRMIMATLPIMKKQKSGKIINITSMSGLISYPYFGIYSASKFAVEAFTTALRYEVAKENVWVTNVEPGAIKSDSNVNTNIKHLTFRQKYYMGRILFPLVTTEQISKKVVDIAISSFPPAKVLLGRDMIITDFAKRFLPHYAWDYLIRKILT